MVMVQQNVRVVLATRSLILMVVSAVIFGFSENAGGDKYTVSLNEKVLLEEYVIPGHRPRAIPIPVAGVDDVLKVEYSHCGKRGVARSIAIHERGNEALKRWYFPDNAALAVSMKELTSLSRTRAELQLVYFSREIPEGKVLATLTLPAEIRAGRSQTGR